MPPTPPLRRPLVAGNWKMNGTRAGAPGGAARPGAAPPPPPPPPVALFPPYPLISAVAEVLAAAGGLVSLGAQACHTEPYGAYTGAVSAGMLKDAGCAYVLCGHSERRRLFHESDPVVAASLRQALDAGLVPILCVGETLGDRRAGRALGVVLRQMEAALGVLRGPTEAMEVAYEPVWAIGTGVNAKPEEAEEVHGWIRDRARSFDPGFANRLRILYGGSVNPGNIRGFLDRPGVDGVLVGGQSLDPEAFGKMVRSGA